MLLITIFIRERGGECGRLIKSSYKITFILFYSNPQKVIIKKISEIDFLPKQPVLFM